MEKFIIEGSKPLKGEVNLDGAKNSCFKLMIASLFADSPSTILECPRIGDIQTTKTIIENLGGEVKQEDHTITVLPKNLFNFKIPQNLGEVSRACTLFIGPLLYRFGKAVVPAPGGDKIGARPINRHLDGLRALGAQVKSIDGFFEITSPYGLSGVKFRFDKSTHTGTDTLIMAAVGAKGKTVLENTAQEPEVDELITFLNRMGAKIKRVDRQIEIEGVKIFKGAEQKILPDKNEAVTFAIMALATKGDILVKKANPLVLTALLGKVKEAGGRYEIDKIGIRFWYVGELKATNITTAVYPGFMTDWQALWTVLMTQAKGNSVVHETIFENRFGYVPYLNEMGAKIKLFNPQVKNKNRVYSFRLQDDRPEYFHAAEIFGPTKLSGRTMKIPDIRAGATLTLAALAAEGKSELLGVEHIGRGYDSFEEKLKKLGASIKRVAIEG